LTAWRILPRWHGVWQRHVRLGCTFPQTKRYAAELTAGTGYDRFDFTIGVMIDGLAHR
jgi:hypothetical protein